MVAAGLDCESDTITYKNSVPKDLDNGFTQDGTYKVCVKAEDAAGNEAYGQSPTLIYNVVRPVIQAVSLLPPAFAIGDSAISAADQDVTSALFAVSGTGYVDLSYKVVAPATDCSLETGYLTTVPQVADVALDGSYKVCVKATDDAGAPVFDDSATFLRDTFVPVLTGAPVLDDVISNADVIANTDLINPAAVTVSESVSLAYRIIAEGGACDGTLTGFTTQVPKSSAGAFISDGSYRICLQLDDGHGNVGYGLSSPIQYDKIAPSITTPLAMHSLQSSGGFDDTELSSTDPLFSFAATGGDLSYALIDQSSSCSGASFSPLTIVPSINQLTSSPGSGGFGLGEGLYKVCLKISDGINADVTSEANFEIDLSITSLDVMLVQEASDGFLDLTEASASNGLVSVPSGTHLDGDDLLAYKAVPTGADCSLESGYGASIPRSVDISLDQVFKFCVRATENTTGQHFYAESTSVERDTLVPNLTVSLAHEAVDGLITALETSATNPLATVTGSGFEASELSYRLLAAASVCDGSVTGFGATMPQALDISLDGDYKVCVKAQDSVPSYSAVYAQSPTMQRDTSAPTFTSISLINDAADSYISQSEKDNLTPIVGSLTGSGYVLAAYKVTSSGSDCSGESGYGSLPQSADLPASDGSYKVCVQLTDAASNTSFGSSAVIMKDATPPSFASLDLINEGSDGYIRDSEKLSTGDLAGNLNASGYSVHDYKLTPAGADCAVATGYGSMPSISDMVSDGSYKVCVKLSDVAGNETFGASPAVVRDTGIPVFTSIDLNGEASDGVIAASEATSVTPLVLK